MANQATEAPSLSVGKGQSCLGGVANRFNENAEAHDEHPTSNFTSHLAIISIFHHNGLYSRAAEYIFSPYNLLLPLIRSQSSLQA
jgi:hypothetical protein